MSTEPPAAKKQKQMASMNEADKVAAAMAAAQAPTSSWIEYDAATCHFPIQNLPVGVFSVGESAPRCGVAIGDRNTGASIDAGDVATA